MSNDYDNNTEFINFNDFDKDKLITQTVILFDINFLSNQKNVNNNLIYKAN